MICETQRCPHCGKPWYWSNNRHCEAAQRGVLKLVCKGCGKKFVAWEDKKRCGC